MQGRREPKKGRYYVVQSGREPIMVKVKRVTLVRVQHTHGWSSLTDWDAAQPEEIKPTLIERFILLMPRYEISGIP